MPPPARSEVPYPSTIAARTNLDAFVGFSGSGRVDWYHAVPGGQVWQQVRWGPPSDKGVFNLAAVGQAAGRAYAEVFSDAEPATTRLYRRTLQGAWAMQVRRAARVVGPGAAGAPPALRTHALTLPRCARTPRPAAPRPLPRPRSLRRPRGPTPSPSTRRGPSMPR